MSAVHRANTWDISDSENESEDIKSSSCVTLDQNTSINESNTSPPSTQAEDSSISADGVKISGRRRRRREEVLEEREAKERRREEKDKLKEKKLQEQQRRKEAAERLNLLKPENFIKSLTAHIHAVLLQDAGCDVLLRNLDGLQWRNQIENQGLPNSIRWTQQALQTEDEDKNEVIEEDQVLMVISHNELEDMVMSHKTVTNQSALIGEMYEGSESLLNHLYKYLTTTAGKVVTILAIISHQQRSGSWGEDDLDLHLSQHRLDTEELLVHLQLYWNVAVHFLFGWQEVTDHVVALTKALSKRPYKALCGAPDLGFCMNGSWSAGVRVDRDGHGLAQVWTRQIQQLNRVSPAMAKAVTTAYPSPSLLLKAYEELPSEEERRRLLADLPVVGGAKERRVGPDLAGRVHRLLTSQNPHLLLD
ncbi:crossover junction endonuclease EME1 isoform X2 [Pimephales promelas]|uniref:crossover junction endonuclease EME1 isoform X2 n=1 Tax=Pimephales promelas TaxID=90988 RepID=UPI0019556B55|nr:crossover junction endonuclease EME1 isoform X2 [Pimephales promelas]KAG1944486.1 putative crossover junction endonuclease EME2 [Pimephales promelas]